MPKQVPFRAPVRAAACAVLVAACAPQPPAEIRTVTGLAQGTTYSLQWVGGGPADEVAAAAAKELERLEALLSNYRPDSTLERFNALRTTEPVELPRELVALLALAKRVHAASAGCFDPTVRPLVRAWGFDGDDPAVPPPAVLSRAREIVGLDKLELLDATHARKTVPELEVDMASIGQGYSAARLAAVLEQLGSIAYLAEIGGEIVARGLKPDGSPWRVGIENPRGGASPILRLPSERATAVVTSGSYRRYFEADGRRYSHIIDPHTGRPVEHALLAATVVGPDAATAAAWGTALLCMGPEAARAALEREDVPALYWLDRDEHTAELLESPAFAREWRGRIDEALR